MRKLTQTRFRITGMKGPSFYYVLHMHSKQTVMSASRQQLLQLPQDMKNSCAHVRATNDSCKTTTSWFPQPIILLVQHLLRGVTRRATIQIPINEQ